MSGGLGVVRLSFRKEVSNVLTSSPLDKAGKYLVRRSGWKKN